MSGEILDREPCSRRAVALVIARRLRDTTAIATEVRVPTLFRFFAAVGALAGIVFGLILALSLYVEPQPREMTVTIPASRLGK